MGSAQRPKLRRGLGNRVVTTPADAAATALRRKRRAEVFELRSCFSITWAQIAARVGVSERQAKKDYAKATVEYGQETAAEHKAKANGRFDRQVGQIQRLVATLQPLAEGERDPANPTTFRVPPDFEASARIASLHRTLAIIETAQARMNGAFAPVVVEHTGNVDMTMQASPAKARALMRDYFGGSTGVRDPAGLPEPPLPGDARDAGLGPPRH